MSQHGVESVTTTAKHLIFPNRDQPGMATSAIFMTVEGQKDLDEVHVTEWGLWTQTCKELTLTIERRGSPAGLLPKPIVKVDFNRSDLMVSATCPSPLPFFLLRLSVS